MPHDDATLRGSLRRLLAVDSYPRTAAMLRADDRLLGDEAAALLAEVRQEADRGELPLSVALVVQYGSFLRRCASGDLDGVFPVGNDLVDPQVVAVIEPDRRAAVAAEAAHHAGGDDSVLDSAVAAWERVLAAPLLAAAYPDLRAALLNDAAGAWLARFWHRGDRADLGRAGVLYDAALDLTPEISARRITRLGNLAMVGREIHIRGGSPDALDGAETLLREAVVLVDRSRGKLAGTEVLTNLALVLRDRYLLGSDPAVLEEALRVVERARADERPVGPRIMLGDLLTLRYLLDGRIDDLDNAVELLDAAVDEMQEGALEHQRAMVDLAIALSERHQVRGDAADINRAVELSEAAGGLLPAAAPDRHSADAQLAMMRYRRFESAGRLDDLDRAVDLLSAVLADAPRDEVAMPTWSANLAAALIQRSRRTGSSGDHFRAADILVELATAGVSTTDRYAVLNNAGNALRDCSRHTPSVDDLDRAVTFLRDALALCTEGTARMATTLANLGIALHDRFVLTRVPADLQEANELTDRALSIETQDADLARRWFVRALVAQTAAQLDHDNAHAAAVQAYREGVRIGMVTDPESTLIAAQDWGAWAGARAEWALAAEAYPVALDALAMLVTTQVVRGHQEAWLRAAPTLSGRAAWATYSAGEPGSAVLALERTRAALLTEALQRERVDLDRLSQERPDLGERYRRAVGTFRGATGGSATAGRPRASR